MSYVTARPRTAARARRFPSVRRITRLSGSALLRGAIALVVMSAMLAPAAALSATPLARPAGIDTAIKQPVMPTRITPPRAPSPAERRARVVRLSLNPAGAVRLRSRERMVFAAVPLGSDGNTVHGVTAAWESSDTQIVFVTPDGQAVAGHPGTARLTARLNNKQAGVQVTVLPAITAAAAATTGDGSGAGEEPSASDSSTPDSPAPDSSAPDPAARGELHNRLPIEEDPLPDDETDSLYDADNDVGMPAGQTEPGAQTRPAAIRGTETPGSANFMLDVPLVGLPGRGVDVALGLTYNSRLWHKSRDAAGTTHLTYDVDSGWPAPGFRLGYGHLEDQGAAGFTLVEPSGTRRQLRFTMLPQGGSGYITTDGSFIRFEGDTVTYPDGTRARYGSTQTSDRRYPEKITDRDGNFILISYIGGTRPRISSIQDTLGRYTRFYYEAETNALVAITVPGYGDSTDRQVVRFYYETLAITPGFRSGIAPAAPPAARVIRYVYFPGTGSGYRYDYSSYGMIYRIAQLRGMTIGTSDLAQTGAVTSDGQTAATTEYDYPTVASDLPDAPQYTRRTDEWAGRTSGGAAPFYTFAMDQAAGTSSVTAPDGTVTRTRTTVAPGQWNDGLVEEITVERDDQVLSRTNTAWEHDGSLRNQRPQRVSMTDEAGKMRSVEYAEYGAYNNPKKIIERGFAGEALRRTETTYEERLAYRSRNLVHLPTSVRVFEGEGTVAKSRVEYEYDAYGTNAEGKTDLVKRGDIIMHDPAYDPYAPGTTYCEWVPDPDDPDCSDPGCQAGCDGTCGWVYRCPTDSPYDPATDRRGNVTQISRYPDPADEASKITDAMKYDVAGNVVEATLDYNQRTSVDYYAENLRPRITTRPDGGTSEVTYHDSLVADPDATRLHSYVETKTLFEANRYVTSRTYLDGRGATARSMTSTPQGWAIADVEYDAMGRAYRSSNPYYGAGANNDVNPSGYWTTVSYDGLGRVYSTLMPDGTIVGSEYEGTVVTSTDQAGKRRRSVVDALGRMTRLDEPNANGNLGTAESPAQATYYEHDALDNLTKVTQGAQQRLFKYDGLSRMTHQRQVEADATLDDAGQPVGAGGAWTSFAQYNAQSLIERAVDARGVTTTFTYDGLNRTKTVSYSDSTPAVTYAYDEARTGAGGVTYYNRGRATSLVTAAIGATPETRQELNYDLMGRVAAHTQKVGAAAYDTSYNYNLLDQMTSETYPAGRVVSHAYDAAARLAEVRDGTRVYANAMQYAAHGGMSAETWGNGAAHTRLYNSRLQLSGISLDRSGTEVQRYEYQYGVVADLQTGTVDATQNNGQLGRVIDYTGGQQTRDERYKYDALGRLEYATGKRRPSPTHGTTRQHYQSHFSYDRYGNRFRPAGDTENVNIFYVPVEPGAISETTNRYTAASAIGYDAAGNITRDNTFRFQVYDYDANNRLRRVRDGNGVERGASTYDAAGQRVATTVGDEWHHYVYDASGRVIAEYGPDGWQRDRIYRGGEMIATDESLGETRRTIPQFVNQFYQGVLGRYPTSEESGRWNNRLNNAQFQGAPGVLAAAKELGDELFRSAEYGGRNRSDGEYVHDLYWGYLQRPADEGGYRFWLEQVQADGREATRAVYAESDEFKALVGSLRQALLVTSAPQWQLTDRLGSVRVVLSQTGEVIGRHDPLPFGDITDEANEAGASPQGAQATTLPGVGTTGAHNWYNTMRTRYAQMEADAGTGLEHTDWRKYDSWQGRWTTPDPYTGSMSVGDPQSLNRYAYVQNDPVNFTDPSGLLEAVPGLGQYPGFSGTRNPGGSYSPNNYSPEGYGGGTTTPDPDPQRSEPDRNARVKAAIDKCLKKLFGLRLTAFSPSASGNNGSAIVNLEDPRGTIGDTGLNGFGVVNDVESYTGAQLGAVLAQRTGTAYAGPIAGYTGRFTRNGLNFDPHTNYTASDRGSGGRSATNPALEDRVGGFVSTQIHELGNSVSFIARRYIGDPDSSIDTDSGFPFATCVTKELGGGR